MSTEAKEVAKEVALEYFRDKGYERKIISFWRRDFKPALEQVRPLFLSSVGESHLPRGSERIGQPWLGLTGGSFEYLALADLQTHDVLNPNSRFIGLTEHLKAIADILVSTGEVQEDSNKNEKGYYEGVILRWNGQPLNIPDGLIVEDDLLSCRALGIFEISLSSTPPAWGRNELFVKFLREHNQASQKFGQLMVPGLPFSIKDENFSFVAVKPHTLKKKREKYLIKRGWNVERSVFDLNDALDQTITILRSYYQGS